MNKLKKEYLFFVQQEHNMKVLLLTNMLYSLLLPIIEIFVGAYIMRTTSSPALVAYYQLMMYIGIIATSLWNGFLLKKFNVSTLFGFGIIVSGLSMYGMMMVKSLGMFELGIAGFVMGAASGFFWTNRYLLTFNTTNDDNRNYFFGLESFSFSVSSISIPLLIGTFISQMEGRTILGTSVDITWIYQLVTTIAGFIAIVACIVLWSGKFENPKATGFIYFKFKSMWNKMLVLASLKGMVQGFLVTAPAILVMKLVGNEGDLGLIQSVSGALTAIVVYVLGRIAKPKDRLKIFILGLLFFFLGTVFNGILFSVEGVVIFVLCKVFFQPLFDLSYYPIMMKTIDVVSKEENRNEYSYILSHEFGLFIGRAFGLILFIFLAFNISENFALRYALIIVGALQLLSYPIAKSITKETNSLLSQ